MTDLTLRYRHNIEPHRGLAVSGIFLIKLVLIVPHMIVAGALQYLAQILAYFGFWIVAFTGEMPQAVHRLLEITFGWTARTWAWIAGIVDLYPPFETDPEYAAEFPVSRPENPSRGWAVAGLLLVPKAIAIIPHIIVMSFLLIGATVAAWAGYVVAAVTGSLPTGIQDFLAGVLQWNLRVSAWFAGLTDEYPPFSLEARPLA
ncbi:MAG: DUF4389 domain-containing protein [Acidimicrobiia bacterium]